MEDKVGCPHTSLVTLCRYLYPNYIPRQHTLGLVGKWRYVEYYEIADLADEIGKDTSFSKGKQTIVYLTIVHLTCHY